jgi:type III pantothenate kinase
MRLALDIGNSRLKWGIRSGNAWHATGSMPTDHWQEISGLLQQYGPVARVLAANVAGPGIGEGVAGVCAAAGAPLVWLTPGVQAADIINRYDNPAQLGADRWAALIGARSITRSPAIVVNAGTATTVDALTSQGEFLGGLILPGLSLMSWALSEGTAGLPALAGHFSTFPTNTRDAMETGRILATTGAIERLAEMLQLQEGVPVRCVLAGGNSGMVEPHLKLPVIRVEFLVLEGLARLLAD